VAEGRARRNVEVMRHGYTNLTNQVGSTVTKTYTGPEAMARQRAEQHALIRLFGVMPMPELIAEEPGQLMTRFVPGRHGQDLIEDGYATQVLEECGRALRALHAVDPATVFDASETAGSVVVHGDFGPNNTLFAEASFAIVAVLDWEFCHRGEPIEDLAWCEWIVRAHHPDAVSALPSLFSSYGWTPPWEVRKTTMRQRCASLEQFCRDWDPGGAAVGLWIQRREQIDSWSE
jgi:aminoglycoside phosphotransferase (APT) family kinase protein